jgi:molecular chaperone HscB
VSLQVDAEQLRRLYLENSRKFHPDFHMQAGDAQQAAMLEQSTLNNEAYKTLSQPDRRIRYVLQLKGLLSDETNQPLPQEFLMEMMDINEGLMELELDFDPERYRHAVETVDRLEKVLDDAIRPTLETWRDDPGAGGALLPVRDYYLKKRYLLRIRENLAKFADQ